MRKNLLVLGLAATLAVGCASSPQPRPTAVSTEATPVAQPTTTEATPMPPAPEAEPGADSGAEATPAPEDTPSPEAGAEPKPVAAATKVPPAKIKPKAKPQQVAKAEPSGEVRQKKPLPKMELVGVMTGDKEQAMIKVDGKYRTLTRGESVGPYTVVSIDRGEVGLRRNDNGQTRSLGMMIQTEANPVSAKPRKQTSKRPAPVQAAEEVPNAPSKSASKPRKAVSSDGSVHLSNKDLDDDPPIQLEGGWRKFETGK